MKKYWTLIAVLSIFTGASAELISPDKRHLEVAGYILKNTDTAWGKIVIPVRGDEIDEESLTKSVTFIDSALQEWKYRPKEIRGYGLRGEHDFRDYVSFSNPDYFDIFGDPDFFDMLQSEKFLRKVFSGKMTLLSLTDKKGESRSVSTFGSNGIPGTVRSPRPRRIFVVCLENKETVRVNVDEEAAEIKKTDLKKLIVYLPELKREKDEAVSVSEFMNAIEDYNNTHK